MNVHQHVHNMLQMQKIQQLDYVNHSVPIQLILELMELMYVKNHVHKVGVMKQQQVL